MSEQTPEHDNEHLLQRTLQKFREDWTYRQQDIRELQNGTYFYLAQAGDELLETALSLQNSFGKKGIFVKKQRTSGLYIIQWDEKTLFSN